MRDVHVRSSSIFDTTRDARCRSELLRGFDSPVGFGSEIERAPPAPRGRNFDARYAGSSGLVSIAFLFSPKGHPISLGHGLVGCELGSARRY